MAWFKIRKFIRFYIIAFISALLMLCLTLLTFWETSKRAEERNENLFSMRTEAAKSAIEKRLNDYVQILKGAQGLIQVSDTISRSEWQDYVMLQNVDENYPGIQGIGYTVLVGEKDIPQLESRIQASGYPDFRVWPKDERELYTSIVYLEPFDLMNRRAFGYDMFSDSVRQQAMKTARDTGQPALTGKVTLVQETNVEVQKGFLLYLPVYKKGLAPLTVEERRKALKGFAYSPFRVNDLMNGVLGEQFDDLDIEIYDGSVISKENLLYDKNNRKVHLERDTDYYLASPLQFGEHNWQLFFAAREGFGYGSDFPWYLLGGGLIISFLIFSIMYSVANIRRSVYLNEVITDNATAALFILDKKDRCTFMNPAAEILTGFTFEEMSQKKLHEQVHHSKPDGSPFPAGECSILRTLEGSVPLVNYEDVFYRKNGQSIQVNINARPIYENGRIMSYLLEVRDITQEKESENALKEKNKTLQTLNNIGKTLSAELELQKLLQNVTDSCTKLTGAQFGAFFFNQTDKKGKTYLLYNLSGASPEAFKDFPVVRNTKIFGPTFQAKEIIRSEDITKDPRFGQNAPYHGMPKGHLPVKSYLAVPVVSRNGDVFGALLFGHSQQGIFTQSAEDIVKGIASQAAIAIDNSKLFEDISSKNQELIQINNELDNFVYTASHDLKAPVLNIEGLLYALNKALKDNPGQINQILELMQKSVLKFKETIQALTDVARTNKNLDEEIETIDIREMIEEINLSIQDMIRESGAQIELDLECTEIRFANSNLRSVLFNLITNAIKYRAENRSPTIKISCSRDENATILQVKDNGMGIPENQLGKIFMMFKRYHTHVEGTGVGLYLVRRIVENRGGSIAVDSSLNEGSTFTISLPEA